MEKTYKTFNELGISFQESSDCLTCDGLSCHNNVTHKNGNEYNLHLSTDEHFSTFTIQAIQSANVSSEFEIEEEDLSETEAVQYICENFNWFECA